jgi:hypothetical protein
VLINSSARSRKRSLSAPCNRGFEVLGFSKLKVGVEYVAVRRRIRLFPKGAKVPAIVPGKSLELQVVRDEVADEDLHSPKETTSSNS